jgi:hypothetical protein
VASVSGQFCFLLILFVAVLPAYCVTTASDVRKALERVASYQQAEPLGAGFSPEFADRLQQLRRRARDFAFGSVLEAARTSKGREAVLMLARRRALRAGLPLRAESAWMEEQFSPSVRIQYFPLPESSEWMGARVHVGIPCGEDVSLYLWKLSVAETGDGLSPELVFARESPLVDLPGSTGELRLAMAVDAANGKPQLATMEAGVWCSSQWRKALLQVLRQGEHPYRAEKMFSHSEMVFLAQAPEPAVERITAGFRFSFHGQSWIDWRQPSRLKRLDVQVDGDRTELLAPQDDDPAAFLEHWLVQPWVRSRALSSGSNLPALRTWHEALSPESTKAVRLELVSHGGCGADGHLSFVHLQSAAPGEPSSTTQDVYGILRRHEQGFRVDEITMKLPPSCLAQGRNQ